MKKLELEEIILAIEQEINHNLHVFSDSSIEYGRMGGAIFYYYAFDYFKNDSFFSKGEFLIEKSIDYISNQIFNNPSLKYKGDSVGFMLSSFGKGLLFIQNNFEFRYDFSSYCMELNEVLYDITKQTINKKDHDYFCGTFSTGYYFLNHYKYNKDEFSKSILNLIVKAVIKDKIILNEEEVYWNSPTFNNSVYLGLSHGAAMIINFLSKVIEFNIYVGDKKELEDVLFKAITFLIRRERNYLDGYFPHTFIQDEKASITQLSMCYGDLGVLYAISNALRLLEIENFDERINELLISTSKRRLNKNYTQDSSILYGCSGLYYLYKDLYNRTNNEIYLESYLYWFECIFKFRDSQKKNLAGFQFEYEKFNEADKSATFSFYWGIGGIGITLMKEGLATLPDLNELLLIG
ncbi:lanthionine synthetase LanC family protein [Myroides odoratus]|uniref:Lanthionine synthetase n=1 Tax=Myroides odoratus TaxID=256 RepID=A0A9Q7EA34_MYROD|nr:lanthionine synthetase LanC family protein [Myroides odoratus]EHQ40976.1 Lanthionine synthetase C family protein [Myroides odoratus DSM 2801]EKB08392.1 hypothetical protein HMPREF9716_01211 [Myroides odoratus CIP 103059]QQU01922.1 lanthionine synthetase [Myroides odoratus]WQD55787.1 lanthionine synthetase LanC family protein [Myroides odoratus]STZ32010.1 Lantibiotic modifying enzyme [Myroides odoratus]